MPFMRQPPQIKPVLTLKPSTEDLVLKRHGADWIAFLLEQHRNRGGHAAKQFISAFEHRVAPQIEKLRNEKRRLAIGIEEGSAAIKKPRA